MMIKRLFFVVFTTAVVMNVLSIRSLQARTISKKLDLKGATLQLKPNEELRFKGSGVICNGTVIGDNSYIVVKSRKKGVINNVSLNGVWHGKISDKVFRYNKRSRQHYQIVANMLQFDTLFFSKRMYYLEKWQTIRMKQGSVLIEGNNVVLALPHEKGKTIHTQWGDRYEQYNLFVSSREEGSTLTVRNLNIIDNSRVIPGWGEDVGVDNPVLYFYFAPEQANILFENVTSDGSGALLHTYNTDKLNGDMVFRNCHIKTCQFGLELGNRESSHTRKIIIDDCSVYRYRNAILVGPISIVGSENQVDSVFIRNSYFYEPNVGNIEVSGANYVRFSGNSTTNMFCYTGSIPPKRYECLNNEFTLCSGETGRLGVAMNIAGEYILISGNVFDIIEKPFPFITVLQTEKTKKMVVDNNTIIYEPTDNNLQRQYFFTFEKVEGEFEYYGNSFKSKYSTPHFESYFPEKMKRYEE